MTEKEIIADQIKALNKSQKEGKIPYNIYIKKYRSLERKWKYIGSMSQVLKDLGVRVTKKYKGWYTYHGINFTVDIIEEACESTWWELDLSADGVPQHLVDEYEGEMNWERKSDAIWSVFHYDKSFKS